MFQGGNTNGVFHHVGYSYGQVGWRGKRFGTRNAQPKHPPKKDEMIIAILKMARRPSKLLEKATRSSQQKTNKGIGSHGS